MANTAPTFNVAARTGKLSTDFGGADQAYSLALQQDGKILALGHTTNGYDIAMARYNADGTLDSALSGGKVRIDFPVTYAYGRSMVAQSDGSILIAGDAYDGNSYNFVVARCDANGVLDATFGSGGKVTTDFGDDDQCYSVAVQADGKIIAAGNKYSDFALARYDANGSPDATFGESGQVTTEFGGFDIAYSVTALAGGKVLAAGVSGDWIVQGVMFGAYKIVTNADFALARYNADGSLDTSFGGGDGMVTADFGGDVYGNSFTVQADGKYLLAGIIGGQFALARYNADGLADATFDGDGKVTTDFGAEFYCYSITVQGDGAIVVAGQQNHNFVLARYSAEGLLDTAFGDEGKVTTDFGGLDFGYSIAAQADGKILLGGYAHNNGSNFALARYNADGSLDSTFGDSTGGGAVSSLDGVASFTEGGAPVVLDSSVSIIDAELVAAGNYSGASITLERLGGPNADDVFSGSDQLFIVDGGNVTLDGAVIGTAENGGGTLTITFNANATQARVNAALSAIAYSNASNMPPASVTIDWLFSDNDASDPQQVTGSTTVNITAVNVLPTTSDVVLEVIAEDSGARIITEAELLANASDVEGDALSVSGVAIASGNGTLADNGDGTWTYTPAANDDTSVTFGYTISDGIDSVAGSATLDITSVNDAPVLALSSELSFARADRDAGSQPFEIVLADFDNDGALDVAAPNGDQSTVSVLLGNGDGTFGGRVAYSLGSSLPGDIVAADLDGDGYMDLITANGDKKISVLLNDGAGGFEAPAVIEASIWTESIDAADLDGDGDVDLVTLHENAVKVLHNNGTGGFVVNAPVSAGTSVMDVIAADLDGDGDNDLVTASYDYSVNVLLNDGSGNFSAPVSVPIGGAPSRVTAADIDQDGDIDLVTANYMSNSISVLRNDGSGGFGVSVQYGAGSGSLDVAATDINGDGKLDLLVANHTNHSVAALLGDGAGGFGAAVSFEVGLGARGVAAGDLNGDGALDVVTANTGGNTVSVLLNPSLPTYTENGTPVTLSTNANVADVEAIAAGSYAGASVTLQRSGSATADDVFSGSGDLVIGAEGGDVALEGTIIGTATQNSDGILSITFNSSATQARVNAALSAIAYSNASDTPDLLDSTIVIDWVFSDNDDFDPLTASGTTTVAITAVDDLASLTISGFPAETQTLTAALVDLDGIHGIDGINDVSYQWRADGVDIVGATDATYVLTHDQYGQAITVTATYIDAYGDEHTVTSAVTDPVGLTYVGDGSANKPGSTLYSVYSDYLTGNGGNDTLSGGLGNDLLEGGTGTDSLIGGAGNDTYRVKLKAVGTTTVALEDIVTEAPGGGSDTLVLMNAIDGARSYTTLTLGSTIDNLDASATGLTKLKLTGNSLANRLTGNAHANTLDGKTGIDTMAGGAGDDTYVLDSEAELLHLTELAGEGADKLVIGYRNNNTPATTPETIALTGNLAHVEHVVVTGAGLFDLIGNAADNGLTGNASANTLIGGDGNDTLNGGGGIDVFNGGLGNDTYLIDKAAEKGSITDAGGIDTLQVVYSVTATTTIALSDGLAELEHLKVTGSGAFNLTGNGAANTLTGNGSDNTLTGHGGDDELLGNDGNDKLCGGDGRDTLNGGAGADTMEGGAGNDTYYVDSTADKVIEYTILPDKGHADTGGIDTVMSGITWTLGENIEKLTLAGTSSISGTGNALANTLFGNAAANRLNGLAGADYMDGAGGSDIYLIASGDHAAGEIIHDTGLGNTDEIRYTSTQAGTFTLNASVSGVERIVIGTGTATAAVATGLAAINLDASSLDYGLALIGNNGANAITGGDGADTLTGNGGADTLTGGAGHDTYVIDANDTIVEGAGTGGGYDTVKAGFTYVLNDINLENLTLTGSSAISGTGNDGNNVITGNAANNKLYGLGGDDTIDGGTGSDSMEGGAGDDTYFVNVTGDKLTEAEGAGLDQVKVAIATAGVTYTLSANVENATVTSTAAINLTGNASANALTGNHAANVLKGLDGDDTLDGGLGNDKLYGGLGADELTGGVGKDIFVFDAALSGTNVDTITDFNVADDTIHLENAIFAKLTTTGTLAAGWFHSGGADSWAAADVNDFILYDMSTGDLYYDADGSGAGAAVKIATMTGRPAITATDFVVI